MNDAAEPIAWAVYGGRTGVLRYVLQDEERVFELTESGYVARPLFEHPAPTPPADDVREALVKHQWYLTRWGDGRGGHGWKCSCGIVDWGTKAENPARYERHDSREAATRAAVGHIAAEVRPYGTVTDATVEQLREARAETWDEAVAAVFAWWKAPEDQRPSAIVNPYGAGLGG